MLQVSAMGQQLQQLAELRAMHDGSCDPAPLEALCSEVLVARDAGACARLVGCAAAAAHG